MSFLKIGLCVATLVAATLVAAMMAPAHAAGALAIGKCGAFGYSFDYGDEPLASRDALGKCKGHECRVVAKFSRMCAAFAVDGAKPCGAFGWATRGGAKLAVAQNEALRQCYANGGSNCMIRAFVCDGAR
jgi:hypothetical protein